LHRGVDNFRYVFVIGIQPQQSGIRALVVKLLCKLNERVI